MVKRLVHYDPTFPTVILLGFGAFVKPLDHDDVTNVSNAKMIQTSPVLSYDGDGCFEAQNSLYVPAVKQ